MAEFGDLVEGAQARWERVKELVAWATAHVMNSSGNMKSPMTAERLLGPEWTLRRIKAEVKRKRNED